jgi:hypothetical protein
VEFLYCVSFQAVIGCLLYSWHWVRFLTYIILFNAFKRPSWIKWTHFAGQQGEVERVASLAKVIHPVSSREGIPNPGLSDSSARAFSHFVFSHFSHSTFLTLKIVVIHTYTHIHTCTHRGNTELVILLILRHYSCSHSCATITSICFQNFSSPQTATL